MYSYSSVEIAMIVSPVTLPVQTTMASEKWLSPVQSGEHQSRVEILNSKVRSSVQSGDRQLTEKVKYGMAPNGKPTQATRGCCKGSNNACVC